MRGGRGEGGALQISESFSGELFGFMMPFEWRKSHLRVPLCVSFPCVYAI